MSVTPAKRAWVLGACFAAFVAALLVCPWIGPTPLHWGNFPHVLQGPLDSQIFFSLRLPRVGMALLCGAALSVAGVAFQALLRNPLADPFTLGLAGGSSLGAVVVLLFLPTVATLPGAVPLAAFAGAILSVGLVYALSTLFRPGPGRESFQPHPMALLLAGITVNYFFSALLLVLYYLVDFTRGLSVLRWILGGLDAVEPAQLTAVFYPTLFAGALLFLLAPSLNLLTAGDELARSKGVHSTRLSLWVFLLGSLLTACVTAFTGPIGFVGLMVPNFLRRFLGYDHRWLIPASAFLGGAFLTFADTLARTCFAPAELPVGALTALMGGPLFILLLLQNRKWSR